MASGSVAVGPGPADLAASGRTQVQRTSQPLFVPHVIAVGVCVSWPADRRTFFAIGTGPGVEKRGEGLHCGGEELPGAQLGSGEPLRPSVKHPE